MNSNSSKHLWRWSRWLITSCLAIVPLAVVNWPCAAIDNDWPQWRGPARNAIALDARSIASLPADLKPVWKIRIGGGHSGPVVAGGKLVYLDEDGEQEIAHLIEAKSGREIWRTPFASMYQDEWGAGPRSTPTIDGARVYVQSCNGEFRCLNLADGKPIWATSFEKDFGVVFVGSKANEGTARRRGNNGSGVIDADRIVLPVGSTTGASLVCFDKHTGAMLWKSGEDEAAYSSLMMATLAGVRQVVAFTADALVGADLRDGKILWREPLKTNAKRHTASPVIIGDTVLVNSHTFGLIAFRISKLGGSVKSEQAWLNADLKINLATPVVVGDYLFSHGPAKNFVCVEAQTGKQHWAQDGFGKEYSSTLAVGKTLLVLTDLGELVLVAANPDKYVELGRQQICGKTWSFPAFAGGKLYVRDNKDLQCFDFTGAK
ncbi:MAG: PQQ-like beta-propeller repeat protein [Verrucomicrobia bacterium]|nr:PQQ-like beta-propeller repeat protein [Verrucomicrobiota bacterium]